MTSTRGLRFYLIAFPLGGLLLAASYAGIDSIVYHDSRFLQPAVLGRAVAVSIIAFPLLYFLVMPLLSLHKSAHPVITAVVCTGILAIITSYVSFQVLAFGDLAPARRDVPLLVRLAGYEAVGGLLAFASVRRRKTDAVITDPA
jgi:hypothetical protein